MELELSLGDSPAPLKTTATPPPTPTCMGEGEGLELALGVRADKVAQQDNQTTCTRPEESEGEDDEACSHDKLSMCRASCPLLVASAQTGSTTSEVCTQDFDVNTVPVDGGAVSARSFSPSIMQVEIPSVNQEAAEDEENGGARKKLRLSKEQSVFLEDSFKEHSTLTPKQKSDLANRLNLRPRQVEVWFQNRRARTKLKQTEVDCEYLKRCCETLTQENRRLQREVAELRAFRTTYPPFYHQHNLPGFSSTVLRLCPSCDSKATSAYSSPVVTAPATIAAAVSSPVGTPPSLFATPHFGPFTAVHPVLRRQPSATS